MPDTTPSDDAHVSPDDRPSDIDPRAPDADDHHDAPDFAGTVDWNTFWREADDERRATATVGAHGKADLLATFFEEVGQPDTFASVGCGPGHLVVDLAERFPSVSCHGVDAAPSAVAEARERAASADVDDVRFAVDALPDLGVDREFDLVYCYATLHYVRESGRAVRALYDRVAPGGHLVFNYPNRNTRATYYREFADDEAFRERFALVFAGENLLSYRHLRELLGSKPRSFWSAVDARDREFARRDNPCVFVPA